MASSDVSHPPIDDAVAHFRRKFGRPPRWLVAAPGRVDLIGGHTDYNDGFVLPMAIDRYVVIAAAPATDPEAKSAQFFSTEVGEAVRFSLCDDIQPGPPAWSNYVRGVVALCQERGLRPVAFDALTYSNVPLGGGLSSSAALEVATATLIEAVTGQSLDRADKALLCQQAEHEYAGVPCGILDQFSSVMGRENHCLLLDCRSREVRLVPWADPNVTVLITDSKVKHDLAQGEYAQRRSQCHEAARQLGVPQLRDASTEILQQATDQLDPVLVRRARHVISENERTVAAAAAVEAGQWETVGRLMFESHASLRDDFEVSCRELDLLVKLASAETGVLGSRMAGGGFGGCTVSLVRSDAVESVTERILEGYEAAVGIRATAFATRPADGARILALPE